MNKAGAFPPALFFERMFYSKLNISFIRLPDRGHFKQRGLLLCRVIVY